MKRRAAETLIEIAVAGAVFLVMMSGICDFIANETLAVAFGKQTTEIKYYAQKWAISNDIRITEADGGRVKFSYEDGILTVTKNNRSVKFDMN